MTSITAQQTKLDLELVLKENRFDIGKCNGRIPHGFSPREPTFQVTLDAIALTPCYPAFLITADVPEVYMHQFWNCIYKHDDFYRFKIDKKKRFKLTSLSGKTTGLDKLRLSRAQIIWEASQKYGAILPDCLTSPAMKESKAYKTYLGYATGEVPPKVARKFKKASPSKKDSIIIREPTVETKSKGKEKKKADVAHGKGIELLSDVALTEEDQMKEVRKKSLRYFHKPYPSGSGTVTEDPPRVAKITPTVTSEGADDRNNKQESSDESSKQENESEEHKSISEQDEESKDDNQEEEGIDQENESEDDELESDEEQGMDDTTDQFNDDADERLEELTQTATNIVQGKGTDAKMTESQQVNENLKTIQEQVVEDAHVTISTVTKKTEVLVTSSSRSSDLVSKFLNFSDIPHTDAEFVSPLDVPVHHEVLRTQAPTFLSIPVFVIPESSPVFTKFPQSSHTFTPTPILVTPTPLPIIETSNPLANLPDFSSVLRFNDRISTLEKEVA
ncbi:hypothetical protein Tco_0977731 [Tanacetum coccineum]|uniref:Uncharacterized protein n=1 Tax=Tanacetum coccineum TaxID=301880 RepID=A0ABQ5EKY1_9ASTR